MSTEFKLPVPDLGRYARSVSLLRATLIKAGYIWVLEITPLRLPVYAHRIPAPFDTPVARNDSNVFEVTTRSDFDVTAPPASKKVFRSLENGTENGVTFSQCLRNYTMH